MMNEPIATRPPARFGLGRGLGSLLPQGSGAEEVDIDLIVPNPRQPRMAMERTALEELAESIRTHGIIQPLIVSRVTSERGAVSYQLIAGERRLHAAREAGLIRVPVVIREATEQASLELALIENVQRADLNPLEEAAAYRRLVDEFGLTQEAVAERAGKSRAAVANTLRLLGLPDPIRASLAAGEISEGHARAICGLSDDQSRLHAWKEIVDRALSVRQSEELVRRLRESGEATREQDADTVEPAPKRPADPVLADLEERLQRSLGTQVKLERSRKGGRIVIRFYGDEDFDALLARLLGDADVEVRG
jgi:ParB family chromosome partitioning protein